MKDSATPVLQDTGHRIQLENLQLLIYIYDRYMMIKYTYIKTKTF